MDNYTSGPLMYDGDGRIDAVQFRTPTSLILEDGIEYIGGLVALPYGCGGGSRESNARRIVACWNALDGVSTERLEQLDIPLIEHLIGADADATALVAERDELLAELRAAHQIIHNALNLMSAEQKVEWARMNDRDGVIGEGTTRANEREAVIARAEGREVTA